MDASPACFVCFDERLDNICGNCSDSDTGRKAEVRKLSRCPSVGCRTYGPAIDASESASALVSGRFISLFPCLKGCC